jgi:hypothetical protein
VEVTSFLVAFTKKRVTFPLLALKKFLPMYWKFLYNFFPSLKQHLVKTVFLKSATFWVSQNCKWNNTHLRSHFSTIWHAAVLLQAGNYCTSLSTYSRIS